MSRYPMTDPITIPPFPQNEKEVPCGLLFSFYVIGAADSNTQGSPSTFRSLSQRSGERIPPFQHKLNRNAIRYSIELHGEAQAVADIITIRRIVSPVRQTAELGVKVPAATTNDAVRTRLGTRRVSLWLTAVTAIPIVAPLK